MHCTYVTTTWQNDKRALRHIRDHVFLQEQQVPVTDGWDSKDETFMDAGIAHIKMWYQL